MGSMAHVQTQPLALPCLYDSKGPRVLAFQVAMSCLPSLCLATVTPESSQH